MACRWIVPHARRRCPRPHVRAAEHVHACARDPGRPRPVAGRAPLTDDLDEALEGLPPTRVAPTRINAARAQLDLGDRDGALENLSRAFDVAPQMARIHPMGREVLRVLVSLHHRANPELKRLPGSPASASETAGMISDFGPEWADSSLAGGPPPSPGVQRPLPLAPRVRLRHGAMPSWLTAPCRRSRRSSGAARRGRSSLSWWTREVSGRTCNTPNRPDLLKVPCDARVVGCHWATWFAI